MQPEHVGNVLTRTLNGNGAHNDGGAEARLADALHGRPRTLPDLARLFEREEGRENPDVTVPLNALTMTDTGLIHVPQVGHFAFNEWSKRQAANLLGIRWDKWFQNASGHDCAEEMNRRFGRAHDQVRLRTMKPAETGPLENQGADGILRAFVSPGYSVIRDSIVAKMLLTFLGEPEPRLIRMDMTDRSTSFVVAVGAPYKKGGPGKVGDVWGGILIRNSGVGFASLLVTFHLTRLLCLNGMTAPLPDALLLKKRHRGFRESALLEDFRLKAADLPGELYRGIERLHLSEGRRVENVEAEVTEILRGRRLPARLLPAVMAAYGREPLQSAFGVSQALTLAAQTLSSEERLDLESAAGHYLAAMS